MMTSSNIFRVTGPLSGEFTGHRWIPAHRPVTQSFDVFFDLRPNKRLNKQPWVWWFETPSWSLWRQCNEVRTVNYCTSSHHDHGANLFCPGVLFCSCKQSLKLYESPIDKHHKYEQNLKRIMRQGLVDVGHSVDRPSDPLNDCIQCTLWITLLQYCGCWWPGHATNCYCIKPFNPEHPDLNKRSIDFLRKWLVKWICLSFTRDDPLHIISMTGLSNQSKYTKRAKTSTNYCGESGVRI